MRFIPRFIPVCSHWRNASSFPPSPRARLNLFASVMEHLAEDSVGNDGSAPPDVGHSGTYTVIQEIAGGVIVELEDGRQCVWRSSAEDGHGPSLAAPATPGVGLADRDALYAAQLAEFHAARNSCHPDWQARIDRINAEAQAYEAAQYGRVTAAVVAFARASAAYHRRHLPEQGPWSGPGDEGQMPTAQPPRELLNFRTAAGVS